MATTKDIAWKIFDGWLRPLPTEFNKPIITTLEFVKVCNANGVADNRTIKQYLEMMAINRWLTCVDRALSEFLNATQSLWKYKHCTWKINDQAKFEEVSKDDILNALFKD